MTYFFPRLITLLATAGAMCGSHCAQAVTVALTITVDSNATVAQQQLAENVLALMEVEAGRHEHLQVVERQQLDIALHELALTGSRSEEAKAQLGRLAGADLILTARLLNADDTGTRNLHVRVTEAETGVVRGETLVPTSAAEIEDTAAEIIDYLAHAAQGPRRPGATIAVLPFESVERFDRLRPLERGLRDLFTSFFLRQEGIRVVQRTSMEQLLSELELVRGGLTRDGRGLEGAPPREATYVLRGEIDERESDDGNLVVIRIELIEPESHKMVAAVERATTPPDMPDTVEEMAEEAARSIANGAPPPMASQPSGANEVDRLYDLALRDVFRFVRNNVADAGYTPFEISGVSEPTDLHATVDPDSALGAHLLKKSIDRLESVLFIRPEQLTAALPLAYCLSFHVEGVWRPRQCEELLRRVYDESSDDALRETAGRLLADMYFPHTGQIYSVQQVARLNAEIIEAAYRLRLEMLASMSRERLGSDWTSLADALVDICEHFQEDARWRELLAVVTGIAESRENKGRLAATAASIAHALVRRHPVSKELKDEAMSLLVRWRDSDVLMLRLHSSKFLYLLEKLSAEQYSATMDHVYRGETRAGEKHAWTREKLWLARHRLAKGDADSALEILAAHEPEDLTRQLGYDFAYGEYGYLLAQCLERLGRKRDALDVYLKYASVPHGYSHGGNVDFEGRIKALGGMALDDDRTIDVRYVEVADGKPVYCRALATDGERLFCSGFENGRLGARAVPIRSVQALQLKTSVWTNLGGPDDRVSSLVATDGWLWAGTDHSGLWQMSLATGQWRHWTTENGLPTNSIVAIAARGRVAYVSAANIDQQRDIVSGGVVRIDSEPPAGGSAVLIYRSPEAPQTAPNSMTLQGETLVTTGLNYALHSLDVESGRWRHWPDQWGYVVGSGPTGAWTASRDDVARLLATEKTPSRRFAAAKLLPEFPAGTYRPRFIVEHQGKLWIGGTPWRKVTDSGLYCLDLAAAELERFGPRDGFRYERFNTYECYDGLWAQGSMWVATSFGLAEVTVRENARRNH